MTGELFAVALVVALLGLLLVVLAVRGRQKRGLSSGETLALDDVTLFCGGRERRSAGSKRRDRHLLRTLADATAQPDHDQ